MSDSRPSRRKTLITPGLFSPASPRPPGEEGAIYELLEVSMPLLLRLDLSNCYCMSDGAGPTRLMLQWGRDRDSRRLP